jgi:uracil phosphoribosyltransferase
MAPPNPRADWEKLGDQFYRKVRLYDAVFDEDLELENYLVAGAPYAGALGRTL